MSGYIITEDFIELKRLYEEGNIGKFENKISVEPLPAGYIKIFDKDYEGEIYIEQYQASRGQTKLRRQKIRRRNRIAGVVLLTTIGIALYSVMN